MRVITFPLQDASIYEQHPTRNTGHDEIIEVGKSEGGNYAVRSLIEFEIPSASLDATYELKLFSALGSHLKKTQRIEVWTASGSLTEGTGYFYQNIYQEVDGVTWRASGSFPVAPSASVRLDFEAGISDVTVDVTSHVQAALSGSRNLKLLLKFPTADEIDKKNQGNVRFFSSNTHTIYHPLLVAKWNTQTYSTGSLPLLPTGSINIVPVDLKHEYRKNENVTIAVWAREKYPVKTFATESQYNGNRYLPATTYYSIVDDFSGVVVVPFDDASRVDVLPHGNFITFDISKNMHALRHYRLLFKTVRNGREEIHDPKATFTVVQ